MKKIAALCLCCLLVLAGCGQPDAAPQQSAAPSAPDGSISVTDMVGRTVTLDAPADRIVALSASDCEILYALGAGDALVGRGEYCDWPEQAKSLPAVDSGAQTNIEQIIALAPQLVVMTKMSQTAEQIAALENAGIQVAESDAQDIDGVYEAISLLGTLAEREAEAQELCAQMQATFAEIARQPEGEPKTIYFEVSPLEWGLWAAGSGTFMDEIAAMLGCKNLFSDLSGWGEISEEQVIARAPDYIVTVAMNTGEEDPVAEILSRPGWDQIPAVRDGKVLSIADDSFSRPGPRLADGARRLSEFLSAP